MQHNLYLGKIENMQNIDQVISELEKIKAKCRKENSPLGFFALLYCEVTRNVKKGIENQIFEDNARMETLDVIFAKRYIDAFNSYAENRDTTLSWQKAFNHSNNSSLILQHILLGINAHINLDLGIAASETMKGQSIEGLEDDFNSINGLLGEMIDDFQSRVNRESPLLKWLDRLGGNTDEAITNFSIQIARKGAWKFTKEYHISTNKEDTLQNRDGKIANLAEHLSRPKNTWINFLIWVIHLFEKKNNQEVMDILEG
jgi:hypothetical protein